MSKFCSNCGKEISSKTKFCPECGNQVGEVASVNTEVKTNGLAIAGFTIALISLLLNFWGIMGVVATVLSAVALPKTGEGKEKGRGMAIAGLSIGIFSIVYGVFQILAIAAMFSAF